MHESVDLFGFSEIRMVMLQSVGGRKRMLTDLTLCFSIIMVREKKVLRTSMARLLLTSLLDVAKRRYIQHLGLDTKYTEFKIWSPYLNINAHKPFGNTISQGYTMRCDMRNTRASICVPSHSALPSVKSIYTLKKGYLSAPAPRLGSDAKLHSTGSLA